MKNIFALIGAIALFIIPSFALANVTTPAGNGVRTEETLITLIDYDANGNVEYIGKAEPGTATDEKGWFIKKIIYDANGNVAATLSANGTSSFDKIWDAKEAYLYK